MIMPATILVVEDDPSMLDGIKDLLQLVDLDYNIQVLTAENGRIGLEVMATKMPDLIISDIMMPEMDGYVFLDRVRQNPAWVHIPFIFLTAKGSKQDIRKGKVSGAERYITKPFDSSEFLELVHGQLTRAFHVRETRQQIMNNLKKDILQILNHEFRTPLTYVTAYYEMLAYEMLADSIGRVQDNDNFYEYLRGIQVGCIRLTKLVEDFIQVIDIRTGTLKTQFAANVQPIYNLDELIQMAIDANRDLSTEHDIQVHYIPSDETLMVYGYAPGLFEIFSRLLNNALKFTHRQKKQGGHVYITTSHEAGSVHIAFRDKGIGFPLQVRDRLFQLFFQYNRGLFEQQGSGIGLTIARAWADLHKGVIEAVSEEQKGSTFTVVLPAYNPDLQTVDLWVQKNDKPKATVLAVEDDPHLLSGLQELLEIYDGKYQFEIYTGENGRVGLELLVKHQPDLIISDIMMPEMGGYEFLDLVRQNPEWVQIPFIFLTAKGERQDIRRGWNSGVEEYITKPYDSDELLELITVQLDKHFRVQDIVTQSFEELKRSILNLITPDFRLPLSSVAQYSEKLFSDMKDVETETQLKESLQEIQNGSLRLTRLVEDIISLAELKTGEADTAFSLRAQPIKNVGILLYDAAQPHMLTAQARGVHIQFALEPEIPYTYSDTSILLGGLQRLVEMGINYCEGLIEAEIVLASACVGDEVHLSLQIPVLIPENDKTDFLTEPGEDAKQEVSFTPGISLIRGIVELHHGRILLQEEEDHTHLIIALPVYEPAAADYMPAISH